MHGSESEASIAMSSLHTGWMAPRRTSNEPSRRRWNTARAEEAAKQLPRTPIRTIGGVLGPIGEHPLFPACADAWTDAKGYGELMEHPNFLDFMEAMVAIAPSEAWTESAWRIRPRVPGAGLSTSNSEWHQVSHAGEPLGG